MEIRNVKHKGLRNFIENNDPKGLPADRLKRIGQILDFIVDMQDVDELFDSPKFQAHVLKGDREGVYSVTVTRNWRITFCYDEEENEIFDLDYEDYH